MNEKRNMTTFPINIKKIMRGYCKNYANSYKNLHHFLKKKN